jgi:hypothetical protein
MVYERRRSTKRTPRVYLINVGCDYRAPFTTSLMPQLAGARIPIQIDIGFGDAVYPEPELASFPVLLPMEAPVIRAYPREASIAEKFHTMVVLDIRNSRMKDFYDIWFMANTWSFNMYYDSLHRLNGGGDTSVCRRLNYDNSVTPPAGVTVANTKTRLIEVSTDNCGSTKFTDEWFSYSARGELGDVYEFTPHSGSTPYHTTATYWPTGAPKSLGGIPSVPTIFYGASTGAGLDGEGRVTEVSASSGTNPVTNVTYSTSSTTNPLGALTGVTFGSADNDSFTYDPNTGRM